MDISTLSTQLSGTFNLILPEALLILAGCLIYLFGLWHRSFFTWSRTALLLLLVAAFMMTPAPHYSSPSSLFKVDSFSLFMRWLGLGVGGMLVLLSWSRIRNDIAAEYYATVLILIAGVNLTAAANDLVSLFLALELVSIPTYLLLYFGKQKSSVSEATIKYFLLSIFSSALLLFGMSYLYGCVGSTNLEAIRSAVRNAGVASLPALLTVALVFIVAGVSFRLTAAPFHFYAPDVYQGASLLPVTFLASIPKLAGFTALVQLIVLPLYFEQASGTNKLLAQTIDLFWIIALVSILLGNVMGLLQNNLRRLLAYSGIAHAGYMLVGFGSAAAIVQPGSGEVSGLAASLVYLVIYLVMTLGFFAVLHCVDTQARPIEKVDDLAGLGQDHPLLALLLTCYLFSLTGLPLTIGFWGKLQLFMAAWYTELRHYQLLAGVMAIGAALGAWYYLKLVSVIYFRTAVKPIKAKLSIPALLIASLCALLLVAGFFIPNALQNRAVEAITPILQMAK